MAVRSLFPNRSLQTGLTAAAVAGEDFDAIQRRQDAAGDLSLGEDFVALELLVDGAQHLLEAGQLETAETIAQGVFTEGLRAADPVGEKAGRHLLFQLMKAGQTEDKGEEHGLKDTGRRNQRMAAAVAQVGEMLAELKHLVEVLKETGQLMSWSFLHFYK